MVAVASFRNSESRLHEGKEFSPEEEQKEKEEAEKRRYQ